MKYSLLLFLLTLASCSVSNDEPIGKWDDNIKLSQKEATFSSTGDSIIITTQGESWWIDYIGLNDSLAFNLQAVNTLNSDFEIISDDFEIVRKKATEIHIRMSQNPSSTKRKLLISLEDGDYFDSITITQTAKQ